VTLPTKSKFDPQFDLVTSDRKGSQSFRDYLTRLDALVAAMAGGGVPNNLVNAANDAAAAAAGVAVGNMYRNGSVLMVRVV
jgi:hypothetical protein